MPQGVFAGEASYSSQLKLSTEKRKVGGSTPPLPTASEQQETASGLRVEVGRFFVVSGRERLTAGGCAKYVSKLEARPGAAGTHIRRLPHLPCGSVIEVARRL
jgi:hypothetical protein